MRIHELIERQGSSISFEFFPTKSQEGENDLFDAIRRLEPFNPTFVSVTYGAGGSTTKNTRHVIDRIRGETSLEPMPHLTCIGQSREELTDILLDYKALGIQNVLALRGDLPAETTGPESLRNGHCYAKDLVKLTASLDGFSIGVAMYPEGHPEAPGLHKDLLYAKQKLDAGAHFAITQMFFDNRYFYDLIEKAQKIGITVPIIPGIMPVTDIGKIKRFSQMCGATLPSQFVDRMEKAKSPEDARKTGADFAIRQTEDLLENGISYFHFYTLNRAEAVSEILLSLNLDKRQMPSKEGKHVRSKEEPEPVISKR
jgi:methylenetetrahydrofolate reductase (NADPH)